MLLAATLALAGCGVSGPAGNAEFNTLPVAPSAAPVEDYRIGANDQISVRVLGEPELSSEAIVIDQAGAFDMLFLGRVEASGKTTQELAAELRQKLGERYLVDPKISVALNQSARQRVIVEGEVKKPGIFPIVGEMRLMQAIAAAEGPTDIARLKDVVVIREANGQRMAARFDLKAIRRGEADNPILLASDTVIVGQSVGSLIYRDLAKSLPSLTSMFVVIGRD